MVIVNCPIGMAVRGYWNGMQVPTLNAFNKCYWEYVFAIANDLLNDNGCLIILQSFDDAIMELVFFARGSN